MGSFKLGGMTLKSLFSKPETIQYPVQERYKPEGLKGHIAIDAETCILCGICQKTCPTGAIEVDKAGEAWRIDRFRCVQCGACWRACPKESLTMENTYTPPATTKSIDSYEVHPKKPERKAPAAGEGSAAAPQKPAMSIEEQRAAMEAKIANMDPEKAAKVRANFEAKIAKQQQQ
ncbi:MAG: 4Fe-4S dicluster domain-containing protein [Coriobacteriaceae bacterium]|nr:4Fe-4S dicluster domain-containing protein [Coriobacteriaceae bacterium]